jgi:hypothetical protein
MYNILLHLQHMRVCFLKAIAYISTIKFMKVLPILVLFCYYLKTISLVKVLPISVLFCYYLKTIIFTKFLPILVLFDYLKTYLY